MPLSSEDFASVGRLIELEVGRLVGRRADTFFTSRVTKRDEKDKLIWVKELGDQPIPLVGFDYDVAYFDESPRGTGGGGAFKIYHKKATVKVKVPKVGELVLIAREMSYDGWPKCFGVVFSRNYVQDLEDI